MLTFSPAKKQDLAPSPKTYYERLKKCLDLLSKNPELMTQKELKTQIAYALYESIEPDTLVHELEALSESPELFTKANIEALIVTELENLVEPSKFKI